MVSKSPCPSDVHLHASVVHVTTGLVYINSFLERWQYKKWTCPNCSHVFTSSQPLRATKPAKTKAMSSKNALPLYADEAGMSEGDRLIAPDENE
jgi:hypothetical protein